MGVGDGGGSRCGCNGTQLGMMMMRMGMCNMGMWMMRVMMMMMGQTVASMWRVLCLTLFLAQLTSGTNSIASCAASNPATSTSSSSVAITRNWRLVERLRLTTRPIFVIGVLFHVQRAQSLGLINEWTLL